MSREKVATRWLWAFAPINASTGIFLTLLPLYILQLGGDVIDVSLATSTYLFSLIPAALVWGFALDYYPERKRYIVFSYFGVGVVLIAGYLFGSLSLMPIFLALYGFLSAAAAPAVNLLLMETSAKSYWPDMVAKLSFASIIGYDCGVAVGFVWSTFFDISPLIAVSGILSFISIVLVVKTVPKPVLSFERKSLLFSREMFVHRLRDLPVLLIKLPTLRELRRLLRMLRLTFLREVPLLYFSIFVFNIGTNIFGVSYAPSLKQNGVFDNGIFLITLTNSMTQTFLFYSIHRKRFFDNHSPIETTKWMLITRAGTFSIMAASIIMFVGPGLMFSNIVLFSILGGSWAFYNVTTSTLVFRTLSPHRQGEILGLYTSLAGTFSFAGALLSGYISSILGFAVTYLVAAILILLSLLLFSSSYSIGERMRVLHDIVTYG